ncbi:MAG: cob(I)yrinic acid a,c-diamide adenosyltransferase [Deinococcus sp.]|nr:cob(I)yrinic acid a,c-diamide adenosyltransferase [Deinococcus sp.]
MMRGRNVSAKQGLVIVHTGDGKGKTTAALGLLLRQWGHGLPVVMLQFMKSRNLRCGEHLAAERLGVEMIPLGDGFTWDSANLERDRRTAQECWAVAKEKIQSGQYSMVILDELTYPLNYGWLDIGEVSEVIRNRQLGMHVVITGRNAPPELIALADLVTEMRKIKHPFDRGIAAQKGIEL